MDHTIIMYHGRNSGKSVLSEAHLIALITKYQIKDILDFMRLSECPLSKTKELLEKWSCCGVDLPMVNTLLTLDNIKIRK